MKKLWAVVLAASLVLAFLLSWQTGLLGRLSNHEALVQSMRQSGFRGPLICIGVQFLQVVFFMIPGEITQIAAGYVFGAWLGLAYSVVGIMLGSAFDFAFARLVGRPVIRKVLGDKTLERVDKALSSQRGQSALFLLFLLPAMPKDAMSYGAGLTNLRIVEFIAISGLGRLPALLFSTMIGDQLYDRNYTSVAIIVAVGALVTLGFFLYERNRRQRDAPHEEHDGS
jgi:uncharacterized membrane protein YdjX (TVP38/TMEM64 family)